MRSAQDVIWGGTNGQSWLFVEIPHSGQFNQTRKIAEGGNFSQNDSQMRVSLVRRNEQQAKTRCTP